MALLEVKCPMCKGSIWVDQSTGKVVDHKSSDQKKVELGDFLEAQKSRASKWDQKMQKAKDETAKRKTELDEQFRHAKEHPDDLKGEVDSPFKWD